MYDNSVWGDGELSGVAEGGRAGSRLKPVLCQVAGFAYSEQLA